MLVKEKKVKSKMTKWAVFSLFFCAFLLLVLGNRQFVLAAFQEPIGQPPQENTPGYLTIGGDNQARSGKLRLGSSDLNNINYQLEVAGAGATIETVIIDNDLTVDSPTLYVDSVNNRVGIGTLTPTDKLSVVGDMAITNAPGIGLAAWGDSIGEHTVYGTTSSGAHAGVAGFGTAADNYGIYGYNFSGIAVRGENTNSNKSSVYGEADNGFGVYGTNTNPLGLWAGYFSGRLESSSDVSGAKFLATQLQSSLVPFTAGQVVADYDYINQHLHYFDGTFIWSTKSNKLTKIRAADGFQVFYKEINNTAWPDDNVTDLIFDGNNIWAVIDGPTRYDLAKIDPYSGQSVCDNRSVTSPYELSQLVSLAFDGQDYWVLARTGNDEGSLFKINNLCQLVAGGEIVLASGAANSQVDFSSGKVIYNGSYLMAIGRDYNSDKVVVFNVNPSTGKAVGWEDFTSNPHYNPAEIFFDNYYYWVTNKGTSTNPDNGVTKFYLSENKICTSQNAKFGNSCNIDSDCDSSLGSGDGACFAQPVEFGTYPTGGEPTYITFDGTYVWLANEVDQSLTRLLAADPNQRQDFSFGLKPWGLLFDGTHLWVSSEGSLIRKIYSGTGYGYTDLSGTLTLQQNSPLIQQNGSVGIAGSGRIGGNVSAQGELNVNNNVWGEEAAGDVMGDGIPLGQGTYNCPAGHFVKNIATNGVGEVIRIECRPL